ncbi:MAG: flagellar basal body-associated FliL family protein [Lachnospiraceae bacterium]|nr:flagellar basal body-associated FliL family protein [Lachnospiraceae bacterium]
MKKNLLSIIILFLLIVNISLTSIMMFSLVLPNQKALALMTDIATVLRLELPAAGISASGEFVAPDVPIQNVETYDVANGESMRIPLALSPEEERTRFVMVRTALSMDSKHKAFKKAGNSGDLSAVDTMIQDIIIRAFGVYTLEEVRDPVISERIKAEIIRGLHVLYDSDFIFGIQFLDVAYG